MAALTFGCGQQQFGIVAPPDRAAALRAGPPLPIEQVWLLERSGLTPMDSTVTIAARQGRVVVMRHPPPDNAIFAILVIPPDTTRTDSIRFVLKPVAGRYAISVEATPRLPPGMFLTFSYAVHFVAPAEGLAAYLSAPRFEQSLGVGRVQADTRLRFIAGDRPAADMLRISVAEVGVYHVAAPK